MIRMESALAKKKTNDNNNIAKSVIHGSDYEIDLENLLESAKDKLKKLRANTKSTSEEIREVEDEIQILESLHENYDKSMNVFRNT